MELWETGLALVVFIAASYYLYRKLFVTGGCSCGNSGCCKSVRGVVSKEEITAQQCQSCIKSNNK